MFISVLDMSLIISKAAFGTKFGALEENENKLAKNFSNILYVIAHVFYMHLSVVLRL